MVALMVVCMKTTTQACADPTPAFLRPRDAAKYCGLSRRYLNKLSADGVLPVIRPSKRATLYARADLDGFLMKFRRAAVS